MIKGEIWWANLPTDPYGSEPGKRRPVLIIQSDAFNRSAIQTTICAVITSNMKLAQLPANIMLEKSVSGLERTSIINFSQIITIDKSRQPNWCQCCRRTISPILTQVFNISLMRKCDRSNRRDDTHREKEALAVSQNSEALRRGLFLGDMEY